LIDGSVVMERGALPSPRFLRIPEDLQAYSASRIAAELLSIRGDLQLKRSRIRQSPGGVGWMISLLT